MGACTDHWPLPIHCRTLSPTRVNPLLQMYSALAPTLVRSWPLSGLSRLPQPSPLCLRNSLLSALYIGQSCWILTPAGRDRVEPVRSSVSVTADRPRSSVHRVPMVAVVGKYTSHRVVLFVYAVVTSVIGDVRRGTGGRVRGCADSS